MGKNDDVSVRYNRPLSEVAYFAVLLKQHWQSVCWWLDLFSQPRPCTQSVGVIRSHLFSV